SCTPFLLFIKEGGSLQEALALIRTAADQSGRPVQDLFGNANSGNAVLALRNNNLKLYSDRLARTAKETGSLGTAVETANTGTIRTFQALINRGRNALDRFAAAFRPLQDAIEQQLIGAGAGLIDVLDRISNSLSNVDWTSTVA